MPDPAGVSREMGMRMEDEIQVRSLGVERRGRPLGAVGQIRAWHHRIAKLVAKGMTDVDVARLVDRSPPTIRNFRNNPANQELIAQYIAELDEETLSEVEYRARLSRLSGTMALERLVEKLEAGEIDSERTLLAIADSTNDRMGISKQTTSLNLNLDLGSRLDAAKQRALKVIEQREAKVIPLQNKRRF